MDSKILDVKPTEAFERLETIKITADKITDGIQECIKNCPFFKYADYSYIFMHKRKADFPNEPDRLIWQPRLAKPTAVLNSMLFKVYRTALDALYVKWILPPREQWRCYQKGTLFENETICNSIYDFQYNREWLQRKEFDDLEDEKIDEIYREISKEAKKKKKEKENLEPRFN